MWVELMSTIFLSIVTQEMGAKNDFQRNVLFSNQFSDYSANLYSHLTMIHDKFSLRV